ncbi:MAG: DUF378 domain-containing protein [Patescibacteria group bacterium]
MKAIHTIAFVLLVIGGLNWLLVGLSVGDIVAYLPSWLATTVYILVGLSTLYLIFTHKATCKNCESAPSSVPQM